MPSFLDKLKSGADKAAFEADRLVRVNQAQSAAKAAQREVDAELQALGRQVMDLYDAGTLAQPELLALCANVDDLRQQLAAREAEVERIRDEKPPESGAEQIQTAEQPAGAQQPEPPEAQPAPAPSSHTCANCGATIKPNNRFCPECGTRVEGA